MEWRDEGIVLAVRRHGEAAAIVSLLTAEHGRHAGLVRGGASRRLRGVLQPGNTLAATWRARLEEHLGAYTVEPLASGAALYDRPGPLATLTSATALLESALPERAPHPELYFALADLLVALEAPDWAESYVRWELFLLADLGFGLDLSSCAATGTNDGLAYVSPKSGRAVSLSAGEPWRDRLLPLPRFLSPDSGAADVQQVLDGLRLTGWFLERHVFAPQDRHTPDARERLITHLRGLDAHRRDIV
ncbi:MAG: DNA repair protein RecO [Rhodospirillales bacterium]|nr:MAG: DNA repair protein RecO [Rhodospirillales bacterium]